LVSDENETEVVESVVKDQSFMTLHQVIVKLSEECKDKNPVSSAVKTLCDRYLEDSTVGSKS